MKKKEFSELVFCSIEKGETQKVLDLCKTYSDFKNRVFDRNGWTPIMYAVRYGNLELLKFFAENEYVLEISGTYGLLHIASFSGELGILVYLIEELKKDPNPHNVETTPLRFACKYQHYDCIEYLFHRGAFLIDENYIHNLLPYRTHEPRDGQTFEVIRYKTLNGNDVLPNMIFRVHEIRDEKIKQYMRWLRMKNFIFILHICDRYKDKYKNNHKLWPFFDIKCKKTISIFL